MKEAPQVHEPIKNTRLNQAMQALLSIIAGLIISDLLKATVATIAKGATPRCDAWANAFVFLAATVFVLRVLVDNVLYYNLDDSVTGESDGYVYRVSLIVCDLVSYALCYAIVGKLVKDDKNPDVVTPCGVAWAVALFFGVELLHWLWTWIASCALADEPNSDPRKPLLRGWRVLSGWWTLIWLVLAGLLCAYLHYHPALTNVGAPIGAVLFVMSMFSAGHYLVTLKDHYMGRALAPGNNPARRAS